MSYWILAESVEGWMAEPWENEKCFSRVRYYYYFYSFCLLMSQHVKHGHMLKKYVFIFDYIFYVTETANKLKYCNRRQFYYDEISISYQNVSFMRARIVSYLLFLSQCFEECLTHGSCSTNTVAH